MQKALPFFFFFLRNSISTFDFMGTRILSKSSTNKFRCFENLGPGGNKIMSVRGVCINSFMQSFTEALQ